MNKHAVIISREWDHPEIKVHVTDQGIAVLMTLDRFVEAVVREAGNPALLMTSDALRKRLNAAAQTVVEKMKQETNKVM